VLAWQTLKIHSKPVLLLNVNGFYDRLLAFLDHCVDEGMLKENNRRIINVAGSISDLLDMLGLNA
jgi:predicted Rossmann-fold nucleotide-binding protein